jgi:hypothetical protein
MRNISKHLNFSLCALIGAGWAIGCQKVPVNDEDKSSLIDNEDGDSAGESKEVGIVQLGTTQIGDVVDEADARLAADGKKLEIPESSLSNLPRSEKIGVSALVGSKETDELTSEYRVNSFKFKFSNVKFSAQGVDWVDIKLDENMVEFDLLRGGTSIRDSIPTGVYKYVSVDIESLKFTRDNCEEQVVEKGDLIAVLTTLDEARRLGQDTELMFGPRAGTVENYDDVLQQIFYYKHSRPVDLLTTPDLVQRNEMLSTVIEAESHSTRTNPYSNPGTQDNTRPECRSESDPGLCGDHVGINTHPMPMSGNKQVDSFYWLLANPIEISNNTTTEIFFSLDPSGMALKAEPCKQGPGNPRFLIGDREQIIKSLVTLGRSNTVN